MPRVYIPPKTALKNRKIIFWIKSSRGTNATGQIEIPVTWSNAEIKEELEQWCSQFGAWESSENFIEYGWNEE